MKHIVAVVIPCYKVKSFVLPVIDKIINELDVVKYIIAVDDKCPENSGDYINKYYNQNKHVYMIHNSVNKGVGGAVITGYEKAIVLGATIVVKIDGDGQMDPADIPDLIEPILIGLADYTKGNRFYSFYSVQQMPKVRLIGNTGLSFFTKLASGYWKIFDPTNGFTAIHISVLKKLELQNLSKRFFFETDMLIHLGDLRAVVVDVSMNALYGKEKSNLKITKEFKHFFWGNMKAFIRRIFYFYYMRDFNFASVELFFGIILTIFGISFGSYHWFKSIFYNQLASTGTVMLATLPIILGFQLLLGFINYDVSNEPKIPLQKLYKENKRITKHL